MAFYETPAFFILLALTAIPAVILGCLGKSIKRYGLVVSVVFLLLLFARDLPQMACFVFYLVWSFALTFITLRAFKNKNPHAKALSHVTALLSIAPLVIYKISAAFDGNILGFLGISYITFKSVQVILEVRDGLIEEMKPLDYIYFLIFFTPFTSGPIMRSRDFVEDLNRELAPDEYKRMAVKGILFIVGGAVYKYIFSVLFSQAMWFLPEWFGHASAGAAALAELSQGWSYVFYMFFDFAGYSLMAVGAGCLFGVKVPMNFRAPFRSLDMKDFWDRWHISLSHWLRDYVFMRISRVCFEKKLFKSRLTVASLGFMANFLLMGVWHGLTWDCLIYGIYHGVLLSLTEIYQRKSKFYKKHKNGKVYRAVSWFVTMNLVMIGMAIFSGQVATILGLH